MKKTLEEKLHSKKIKRPNKFIYNFLGYFWKFTVAKKYHINAAFIDDPRKEKGAYVLLSNHASRMDYIFTAVPLLPQTFNFVVGYNEFFRSHLHGIFSLLHEIPKKNFTPDMYSVIEMKRVINKGGRLTLFPEGMSSISGGSQPVALGTAKLLKFLNVPVYLSNIKGAYLVSPKFNLKERKGKVNISFKKLFSVDDLRNLVASMLEQDPKCRPTAANILTIPFITQRMEAMAKTSTDTTIISMIWMAIPGHTLIRPITEVTSPGSINMTGNFALSF